MDPFPIENTIPLLADFAGSCGKNVRFSHDMYLDLAESIVDEAVACWFSPDGVFSDPYEASDRWQGGTTARFVCPAAILINRSHRNDLLPVVMAAMGRLCEKLWNHGQEPGGGFPPGVLDLICKEIVVAYTELRTHVNRETATRWQQSIRSISADTAYTGTAKLGNGQRLTNYEVYASVAEHLRQTIGAGGDDVWLSTMLGKSLEYMTEYGMYRDPGDPMLYDLSVRQNLAELLHYRYDGTHRNAVDECLRRGGIVSLMTASPNGWAPYGGRSNLFIHNEAMLAYICEFEARRYRDTRPDLATLFKGTAHRAIEAIAPFVRMSPPHNLKNRFDPATKFGRDTGYGEYGVYSLLAASLLARTSLVDDDAIPASDAWPGQLGTVIHLYPAFHRTFAAVGNTQLEMDTNGQPGYDATGIGRIHVRGIPEPLGLSLSIAEKPKYITGEADNDRSAAICPGWCHPETGWQWLCDSDNTIDNVLCHLLDRGPTEVRWEVEHHFRYGPEEIQLRQTFSLQDGILVLETSVISGKSIGMGIMIPCLLTDGQTTAETTYDNTSATVMFRGASMHIDVPDACESHLDPTPRASREAIYQILTFRSSQPELSAQITFVPDRSDAE